MRRHNNTWVRGGASRGEGPSNRGGKPGSSRVRLEQGGRGRNMSYHAPPDNQPGSRTKGAFTQSKLVGNNQGEGSTAIISALTQDSDALARRAARFAKPKCNRYEELKKARPALKQKYIDAKLMLDPDVKTHVANAITIKGICEDMCPEFERYQRIFSNDVNIYERDLQTGEPDHSRMVKKFTRSSAGEENPLPCELRPPAVLIKTLHFLVDEIIGSEKVFSNCHSFVRDRTRSIRRDFTFQHCKDLSTAYCHEVITRFHILAIHELCEQDPFFLHEEVRQLKFTLTSLFEVYTDLRKLNIFCPNEFEFLAFESLLYFLPEKGGPVPKIHPKAPEAAALNNVLELLNQCRAPAAPNMTLKDVFNQATEFFAEVFLLNNFMYACLIEIYFPYLRRAILEKLIAVSNPKQPWFPLKVLAEMLAFGDAKKTLKFCRNYSLQLSKLDSSLLQLGPFAGSKVLFKVPNPDPFRNLVPKTSYIDDIKGKSLLTSLLYGSSIAPTAAELQSQPAPKAATPPPALNTNMLSFKRSNSVKDNFQNSAKAAPAPPVVDLSVPEVSVASLFSFKDALQRMADTQAKFLVTEPTIPEPSPDVKASPVVNSSPVIASESMPIIEEPSHVSPTVCLDGQSLLQATPAVEIPAHEPEQDILPAGDFSEAAPEEHKTPKSIPSPVLRYESTSRALRRLAETPMDPALKSTLHNYEMLCVGRYFSKMVQRRQWSASFRERNRRRVHKYLVSPSARPKFKLPEYHQDIIHEKMYFARGLETALCAAMSNLHYLQQRAWGPLDVASILTACASKLKLPKFVFNQGLVANWRIPIAIMQTSNLTSEWLRQKLTLVPDQSDVAMAKVDKIPLRGIEAKATLTLASSLSAFGQETPTELDFCTPIFQCDVLDNPGFPPNYWEDQCANLKAFVLAQNFDKLSKVGVIYWPVFPYDSTTEQDVRQALVAAGLPESLLSVQIMAQDQDLGLQLQSLLDSLASAAKARFRPVLTWASFLDSMQHVFSRLTAWMGTSVFPQYSECFFVFYDLALQTLVRCAKLVNVPTQASYPRVPSAFARLDASPEEHLDCIASFIHVDPKLEPKIPELLVNTIERTAAQFFKNIKLCTPHKRFSPDDILHQFEEDVLTAIHTCETRALIITAPPTWKR
ncbi:actin cytoskeleton and mitosis protein, variant 2 [Entomophthora muscae]|nr:actin cytoskeleton and mitosis protein, variant 2 [Entomophthora muscae]